MNQYKIAVFVGSLRKESINRRLALALEKLAGDRAKFEYIQIGDVPLYNQDHDTQFPAQGTRMKNQVRAADAVLFVTPEYNRSIPGVLKNAIDTASRPYGDNAFAGKPAAVVGASIGAIGSAMAQQHLRNVLVFVDLAVMPQPEAFVQFKDGLIEADGTISNDGTRQFLQGYVDKFLAWTEHQLKA
ncbi:NADPH-dependent FMN reductase [Stenotrophomonas terrae]|uniref:NADPH-dependent FMN reductase n=1 Tax=Stenotrophomonas terrae TaxID=405446 RepID=A0A0R0CC65_9GAMM|nr:NADPH-dependent FMN reductase [Stenotrophomonas terrae]KRG67212.1 NADPH-dependent FMN reductase [Stenotrophomonas terrae]